MPATTRPLFERIDHWIQEIDSATKTAAATPAPATSKQTKKAATKAAGPSGMGKSTHPSDDVDDNTHPEETGARFAENTADIKKDVPGTPVDETEPGSGGDQDSKQYNIGTQQSATGEDPSVEDDYKGDKDDPGTSHPMNAEELGEKYSSMDLKQLLKVAEAKANDILADIGASVTQQTQTQQTVAQKVAAVKAAAPQQAPQAAPPAAPAATGYDAAAHAVAGPDMDKLAADFIAQTIRDAETDADLVGSFIYSYQQARTKKADDEAAEGEDHKEESPGSGDGGDSPPNPTGAGAPSGGDAGGGGDVLSALGAGGGGAPPEAAPPAAPPGGGGDAGGMSQAQALQELAMALQELGINPEELAQLAQGDAGAGAGAGGGLGGGLGGAGAMPPPAAAEGAKLASAVRDFKRSGKFKFEEAKTAAQRQARDQIKDYIRELIGSR